MTTDMMTNRPAIGMIAAIARNHAIGEENDLPWGRLPTDMIHFRTYTIGKSLIMGRKTAQSMGCPLSKRRNIVLTRKGFSQEGFVPVSTPEDALEAARGLAIMIVGGEEIYRLFLPLAQEIYLTRIDRAYPGDAFFPELNLGEWEESLLPAPMVKPGVKPVAEEAGGAPPLQFVKLSRRGARASSKA